MPTDANTPVLIDLSREKTIDFREVPKFVEKLRGHRPHISAVYRWAELNRDGVALEYLQTPKGRITSVEAIQRYFERLTRRNQPFASLTQARPTQAVISQIRKQRVAAKLGLEAHRPRQTSGCRRGSEGLPGLQGMRS